MKKAGRIFSLIFFISFITLITSVTYSIFQPLNIHNGSLNPGSNNPGSNNPESNNPESNNSEKQSESTANRESDISGWMIFISLTTSTISAMGVASTTLINWRKESRESKRQKLENDIRKMEAEKLRRELNKSENQ